MDFLKIKNTDSLLRDYYQLSEAAQIIGCDEKDIMWYAQNKNIQICMEFHDNKHEVSSGLSSELNDTDLIREIQNLPKDDNGYFTLSENSFIRVDLENIKYDDVGYLTCNIKGYYEIDNDYKKLWLRYEGQPDEWPFHFNTSEKCLLSSPIKIYIHYDERDNYYLSDTLWITKKQIGEFLRAVTNDRKPKNKDNNYQSQSIAQKNKHAVPRTEILMAVISLFHRDMNLRRESPAAVADQLFAHAHEFWPEKGEPPLSYETIVTLLRSCMKNRGLTFI